MLCALLTWLWPLQVPGEMFELAMEARRRSMGVVGSTQNILDFIAAKLADATRRPFPDTLQVRPAATPGLAMYPLCCMCAGLGMCARCLVCLVLLKRLFRARNSEERDTLV